MNKTWHELGWQGGPLKMTEMTGRSQSANNWGKAARGIFLLPQAPLNPGPGPRVFQRRGSPGEQSPTFIIDAFRAGIDWTEDSAVGKGLDGAFSPGHSPAGFLLPGAEV